MLRNYAIACLLTSAALTLQATAQRPFVALLRDPSGNPVADARVWLAERPAWRMAALPQPLPQALADVLPTAIERTGSSDARGKVKITLDTAGSGHAIALITTERGLGALIALHAGNGTRVTLRPMAEIATATASEPFALHATARLPGFGRHPLPSIIARSARLPAGNYEVWAHSPDGWIWRSLQLARGRRAVLEWSGAAQRLTVARDAIVHPGNHAGLDLHTPGEELILRGSALAAPLITWLDGTISEPTTVPGPPTEDSRAWPPANPARDAKRIAIACPDPSAVGVLMRRDASGDFTLLACSGVVDGHLDLPANAAGDGWLLLLSNQRAPAAWPWTARNQEQTIRCEAGSPLRIEARDERGLPVVDLHVAYVPDGAPCAEVRTRTDVVGAAHFGMTTGPGELLVRDQRFANQRIELDGIPSGTVPLTVTAGASVHGVAKLSGDAQPSVIVVTLRDPTGRLQPATRTRTVRPGERFTFDGLEDGVDLLLFATARRDGQTWSVRLPTRVPNEVELVLENEDPVLRPGKRD